MILPLLMSVPTVNNVPVLVILLFPRMFSKFAG